MAVRREERHVVVGDGDVGAATAHRLARVLGSRVLLLGAGDLDPVPPAGPGRIVRVDAAHPDDARTALAPAALAAWRDLERLTGRHLVTPTLGVVVADRRRPDVGRLAAVADRHGLDFAVLDAAGLARHRPALHPGPDDHAFVQADSGLLDADRAAAVHRVLAAGHGAELRGRRPVRALRPGPGHVEVVLDDEVVAAARVVVAAGAGTVPLLAGYGLGPVCRHVEQTVRHPTARMLDFVPSRFPAVTWRGVEASATGGTVDVTALGTDQDVATRLVVHGPLDPARRRAWLAERLPGFAGELGEHATAPRAVTGPAGATMLVGALPGEPRVAVAVGTGRSPMFAGVVGRALADLVLTGRTRVPVAAFSPASSQRDGIRIPVRDAVEGSR